MPAWNRWNIRCLTLCLFFALGLGVAQAQDENAEFLLISDIHFNPFGDSTFTRALANADVSEWETMYKNQFKDGLVSTYGYDSNFWLMQSALENASSEVENPMFIIYPGDFLAHEWYSQYTACFGGNDGYAAFTQKVIAFMGLQFDKYFKGVPVIPTLGNDDALCGDYMIQAGGLFLKQFAETWTPYMHLPKHEVDIVRDDLAIGGYYKRSIPGMPRHTMIVLNTVFMHPGYPASTCADGEPFRGMQICDKRPNSICELQWLRNELAAAQREKQKVWLLMHIPPGLNAYSTGQSGAAVGFWEQDAMDYFIRLLEEFPGVVQFSFAGHTHMDDYRVINYEGGELLTKIAPAVSPIFDNNPAFQVYEFGRKSGAIHDYDTYYLNIGRSGARRQTIPTCYFPNAAYVDADNWEEEYEFNNAYNQEGLTAAAVTAIMKNTIDRQQYGKYYGVGSAKVTPGILAQLKVYGCCVVSATPAQYSVCN